VASRDTETAAICLTVPGGTRTSDDDAFRDDPHPNYDALRGCEQPVLNQELTDRHGTNRSSTNRAASGEEALHRLGHRGPMLHR
jgi:hypothetical protein